MLILGIETSCDETSVAAVKDGRTVVCQLITSQIKLHKEFAGVVPEIASRAHLDSINWMLDSLFRKGVKPSDLDVVAVTFGPGLIGSLLTGYITAEAISYVLAKPIVEVNHLEGHLFSAFLGKKLPAFPLLSFIVSGGHTDLIIAESLGKFSYIGRTRDDACGEAYDKVARLLGFGYPGGPIIDKESRKGDPDKIPLPRILLPGSFDFSFSGLKTAVLYKLRALSKHEKEPFSDIDSQTIYDLAASFQKSAVNVLVSKALKAALQYNLKTITLGGGVSANSALRSELTERARSHGIKVYIPDTMYCTDNAAMIASAAYYKIAMLKKKKIKWKELPHKGAVSTSDIENWV
jgi:N6-L-threonylcarbamoyladenine synthase